MSSSIRAFVAVALLAAGASVVVPAASADAPYAVGDRMAVIELKDQHGRQGKVDATTRQFLFTRDMDAGDTVKAALAEDGPALLSTVPTLYLADISAMPGLVRRMFAMPGMRKRAYPMLLDVEGDVTARIPREAGRATLVRLDALKIVEIRFLASHEEVRSALGGVRSSD